MCLRQCWWYYPGPKERGMTKKLSEILESKWKQGIDQISLNVYDPPPNN